MNRPIQRFISASDLAPLLDHATRLGRLQTALEACLPPQLAQSCRAGGLRDGVFTISTPSNAVAARIAHLAPSLILKLGHLGENVQRVRTRVQPHEAIPQPPPRPARSVPASAKQALAGLAASLPADDPLRAALQTLIDHTPTTDQ